jgi:hypothetical protein
MKIKIEDKDFIEDLERLQNEVQSRQSIISYMISNDMDIATKNFQIYQQDYMNYLNKYNQKKEEVEKRFIIPKNIKAKSWSLDFATGELIVK